MTPVSITLGNGTIIEGHYRVQKGVIDVSYQGARKSTQVGGTPAIIIAQMLLKELVAAAN